VCFRSSGFCCCCELLQQRSIEFYCELVLLIGTLWRLCAVFGLRLLRSGTFDGKVDHSNFVGNLFNLVERIGSGANALRAASEIVACVAVPGAFGSFVRTALTVGFRVCCFHH